MRTLTALCKNAAASGALVPLLAALAGYAIILDPTTLFHDGDTYWHITVGGWMLDHRQVPANDVFSYSFAGHPWVAHEWLSEILMALAWRLAGWNGIVMLFATTLALTLGLLAHHLARWMNQPGTILLTLLAAACIGPSLLARPHILALPVLELWTAGLLVARARDRAPHPWLLALIPLWANLHGSFIFGIALAAPLALEAAIAAGPAWRTAAARWAIFILAAIIFAAITPHGVTGLVFPLQLMRLKELANISEWQPPNFQGLPPIEPVLMLLLYIGLSRGVRLPLIRLLIALGLLYLALQHARHQMLVGIVGTLVLAEPLAQQLGALATRTGRRAATLLPWAFVGLPLLLLMTFVRFQHPLARGEDLATPVAALAAVPAAIRATPVLNQYIFGGYLIFEGVPPFVDGRTDMYGDDFLAAYDAALRPNRAAFAKLAAQYHFGWTILATQSPANDMLDSLPNWRRFYADKTAIVHVRADLLPADFVTVPAPP